MYRRIEDKGAHLKYKVFGFFIKLGGRYTLGSIVIAKPGFNTLPLAANVMRLGREAEAGDGPRLRLGIEAGDGPR